MVDKKVDSDLTSQITELKMMIESNSEILYSVQMEQIKPIKEQAVTFDDRIASLLEQL